jgi:hypothetical protein
VQRKTLGLPENWDEVESWIDDSRDIAAPAKIPPAKTALKNPEIEELTNYSVPAQTSFWENFPENYPVTLAKNVDVNRLESLKGTCWDTWTLPQKLIAKKAVKRLKGKLLVKLKKDLPPMREKNAKTALENGREMTDVLATWIKKKYVAGPFEKPPCEGFRANPLMAAVQKTKVRPIMNLSSPKGTSFNDAVDEFSVGLLKMSSAKLFGEALVQAGKGAVFAKEDIQDAYKLIPNPVEQWHLYGFEWLGRFFFDTTTVFGSKAAPASFDALPETIVNIVCTLENIPKRCVHRQLDDVPVVSPKGSGLTDRFVNRYRNVCAQLKIPLAPYCDRREKAFGPGTYGTVLGINFDSETLTWNLSAEKEAGIQAEIDQFLAKSSCTLIEAQKLHGKLSDFSLSCEFMLGFRFHLVELLTKFGAKDGRKLIPRILKDDLWVWKKAAARTGLPLREVHENPPLDVLTFVSDAAGASLEWVDGKSKNTTIEGDRGVAAVQHVGDHITWVGVVRWPKHLLVGQKSKLGKYFGSKSTTLETVGLFLPLIARPRDVKGRHVLLQVDNTAVVYSWQKKYCGEDPETSLLIRCLHVLEAFLKCKIYVKHLKRMSNPIAAVADGLSRQATTTPEVLAAVKGAERDFPGGPLVDWLENPILDWDLPGKIVAHVKTML